MEKVHLDFETFSLLDLRKVGAWAYAEHSTTRILCASYAGPTGDPISWLPSDGAFPQEVLDAVEIHAWNSFFEFCIMTLTLKLDVRVEQMHDTQAASLAAALPRALGDCAEALDLPSDELKDKRGKYLINKLCSPDTKGLEMRKPLVYACDKAEMHRERKSKLKKPPKPETLDAQCEKIYNDALEEATSLLKELYGYCDQDVITERAVSRKLRPLSSSEREVWLLDQRANIRGIKVDVEAAKAVVAIYENEKIRLRKALDGLTGLDNPNSRNQFLAWLQSHGWSVDNCRKDTLIEYMSDHEVTAAVREACELRMLLAKTPASKYAAALRRIGLDGRLHGMLLFHGASHGRWASTGINLQNLPRGSFSDADVCLEAMMQRSPELIEMLWGDLMEAITTCIRGIFIADEGKVLMIPDYSAIEARVSAWFSDEKAALKVFEEGGDIYLKAASEIFARKITKEDKPERQVGKTTELSMGFGGGIGAFGMMAKNFNVDVAPLLPTLRRRARPEQNIKAEKLYEMYCKRAKEPRPRKFGIAADLIKQLWRESNPNVVAAWRECEDAAKAAISRPFKAFKALKAAYRYDAGTEFLHCKLPSGRLNSYYKPRIEGRDLTYMHRDSETGKFQRKSTFGGSLYQDIVSGTARDIMAHAWLKAEREGYSVVLTVHDELVSEEPEEDAEERAVRLAELMCELPDWAEGLPVAVPSEGIITKRYKK